MEIKKEVWCKNGTPFVTTIALTATSKAQNVGFYVAGVAAWSCILYTVFRIAKGIVKLVK